jgi:PKD repeat protein
LILSIYPPTPQITSPQSVTAVKGRQFAFQVVAANQPSFYNVSELPIGLTIGATDGLISGIPQDTGAYTATITASNGSGSTTQTLTVIVKATSSSQLLNLSTRLPVGTGDNVLIGGFIFQGGTPKTVLIRGLGPSLGDLGVQGTLADPVLELHDSTGVTIATNDNWRDSQAAEISATGLSPTSDLESAILATLPGDGLAYTAILRGQSGGTGVGLVEVYDVDEPNGSVLVNISTRGTVGTADNVLIGGFISGSGVGNVLVRALGPSLAGAGVTGVLADPVLELHDIEGNLVASNDNWKDSQADQIEGTGIPPTDDHESAIFATLPAGAYTAVVQGKDNGTGIGLVETYLIE